MKSCLQISPCKPSKRRLRSHALPGEAHALPWPSLWLISRTPWRSSLISLAMISMTLRLAAPLALQDHQFPQQPDPCQAATSPNAGELLQHRAIPADNQSLAPMIPSAPFFPQQRGIPTLYRSLSVDREAATRHEVHSGVAATRHEVHSMWLQFATKLIPCVAAHGHEVDSMLESVPDFW